jgi:DNA-binding IclR family transcriptional regulator
MDAGELTAGGTPTMLRLILRPMATPSSIKSAAPALERGLAVLEVLAKSRGGLTLSQITRYLDLPKSSVFCLLHTLDGLGYLYRDPDSGKYSVSLRICTLANIALNGISIREKARNPLKRLCTDTGLTVHMGVLENGCCVLIEKVSPASTTSVATWVGKHLSLHCTAIGKAAAACLPEQQLERIIRDQGLLRHNENTICSMRKLKQELAAVRERGYAIDDEEEEIGVRCVGAPIVDRSKVVGALSVVGTTSEIDRATVELLARHVISTAREISEQANLPDPEIYDMSSPLRELPLVIRVTTRP